ncbi:hypothetical protein QUA35_05505 [Microcoleus sp. N9_B2]|uniref:hypothetical protein n=1 Tax=unclassified Microcoleus TaxID=2642155 RepID=UPI002FD66BF0
MVDNIPKLLYLDSLSQSKPERPGWSLTFGATCQDAAAVCLDDQNHPYRVNLLIDGIQETQVELQWNPIIDTLRSKDAEILRTE